MSNAVLWHVWITNGKQCFLVCFLFCFLSLLLLFWGCGFHVRRFLFIHLHVGFGPTSSRRFFVPTSSRWFFLLTSSRWFLLPHLHDYFCSCIFTLIFVPASSRWFLFLHLRVDFCPCIYVDFCSCIFTLIFVPACSRWFLFPHFHVDFCSHIFTLIFVPTSSRWFLFQHLHVDHVDFCSHMFTPSAFGGWWKCVMRNCTKSVYVGHKSDGNRRCRFSTRPTLKREKKKFCCCWSCLRRV